MSRGWTIEDALTKPVRLVAPRNKTLDSSSAESNPYKSPEHQIWAGMVYRCRNVSKYRDRGIRVQEEWQESFLNFYSYLLDTIGLRPSPKHQLDRIAGGSSWYCEFNIRWVLPTQNARNQTTNRLLTFQGRTQNLSAWAEEIGIKPGTLRQRLEYGWSIEKALTTPLRV